LSGLGIFSLTEDREVVREMRKYADRTDVPISVHLDGFTPGESVPWRVIKHHGMKTYGGVEV
jgi:hypothetical protein